MEAPPEPALGLGAETQPADTASAAIQALLDTRPPLRDTWFIRLLAPLIPGQRYLIDANARNPGGVSGASQQILLVPIPADST